MFVHKFCYFFLYNFVKPEVRKSKRGRPIYSPLHNFVNKEMKRNDEIIPDLVGGSAIKKSEC